VPFEEVALKFLDAGERDALRSYLISRLDRTRKSVSFPFAIFSDRVFTIFYIAGLDSADDVGNMARRILSEQM
jgi:hypothetical protein